MDNVPPEKSPYRAARDRMLAELESNLEPERLRELGAEVIGRDTFTLPLLRWECRLEIEPYSLTVLPEGRELDVTYQVLLLDYLSTRSPVRPAGQISFADFPEARGYLKPFQGRVIQRLTYTAGASEEGFKTAAVHAGGEYAGSNPCRFLFRFFPLFEMQMVRYEADEDFPHSCNLFFSDNALNLLNVESMIVCAEKLVSIMQGKMP